NIVQLRTRLEQLQRQICRIVIQYGRKSISGMGFLLGPDIVITNYHVLKEVIDGDIPSEKIKLYFDYKLKEDGQILDEGKDYQLAEDWLADLSENSELDRKVTDQLVNVEAGHLDYVLLRLKKKPGEELIRDETMRGWIEPPEK